MNSFMISILDQILIIWMIKSEKMRYTKHVAQQGRKYMHTKFYSTAQKGRDHLHRLAIFGSN
jgi:hypothetical protein